MFKLNYIVIVENKQKSRVNEAFLKLKVLRALCFFIIALILLAENSFSGQFNVLTLDDPAPGYIKLDWQTMNYFFLVDNYGSPQFADINYVLPPSMYFKLLHNGYWISCTNNKYYYFNDRIELIDSIPKPALYDIDFHDVELMPNGHFMLLCSEVRVMDLSELVDGGDANANVIGSVLFETDRNGTEYFIWKALDHFNILDATSDIDLTQHSIDFNHGNSIVIDIDGNILFSSRNLDEISKINKNDGSFIWRMGGSACENNEFTILNDDVDGFQGFSHQHSLNLLPNGNFLLLDNGNMKPYQYSRAVEYQINQTNKTISKVWEYRHSPDIFRASMGNVQRLSNGNTLVNWSIETIEEVRNDKSIALKLQIETTTPVYRAYKTTSKMDEVSLTLNGTGNYSFNDSGNETDLDLSVSSINGSGLTSIEKHYYYPPTAAFSNKNFSFLLPYRWVFNKRGISSLSGSVKIYIGNLLLNDEPQKLSIYQRAKEATGNFTELNTSYTSSSNELVANFSGFGEFVIGSYVLSEPILKSPNDDNFGIPVNGYVKWNVLQGATKYFLQISRSSGFSSLDVNQTIDLDTSFAYENLLYNTEYFWRIKGVNSKDTSDWSNVNSFTTELESPVLSSPGKGFVGFHLNDSLHWNNVSGAQKYWLQVSLDSNFLTFKYQNNNLLSNFDILDSLNFNTKYFWRVCSFRSSDTSRWSETSNFTTTLATPILINPVCDTINIPISGDIIWQPVSGALSYSIQVSKDLLFSNFVIEDDNLIISGYSFKNLDFNETYYFRVKAKRSTDSSRWSDVCNFNTLLSSPKLISPRTDSILTSDSVSLSWSQVQGANNYYLQVSESRNFDSNIIVDDSKITQLEFNLKNLPPEREIYWRVMALAAPKLSEWSEVRLLTSGRGKGISAPLLAEPHNNSTNNEITGKFYWSGVEKAISYALQVSDNTNFLNTVYSKWGIDNTFEPYSGFEYGKTYYWRVKAITAFDSSNWSEIWKMKTMDKSTKDNITLISPGYDALQVDLNGILSWEAVKNAQYYLQVCENEDFINNKYDVKDLHLTEFSYYGLDKNKEYFWRVKYVIDNDTSAWSDIWFFKTASTIILETPELEIPVENQKSVPVNGTLRWSSVEDVAFYHVIISENSTFYPVVLNERNVVNNKYNYSGLKYNTIYYWRIAAANDNATSRWSTTREFQVELKEPTIVFPSNDTNGIDVIGKILWTESEGAENYNIQISSDSIFKSLRKDLKVYQNFYDFELPDNTINYCRVKAIYNSNESKWSRKIKFIIGNGSDVSEKKNIKEFVIIPNPVDDNCIINFQLEENSEVSLSIVDVLGTNMFTKDLGYLVKSKYSFGFDLSFLNDGIYFIQIKSQFNVAILKLIIQK